MRYSGHHHTGSSPRLYTSNAILGHKTFLFTSSSFSPFLPPPFSFFFSFSSSSFILSLLFFLLFLYLFSPLPPSLTLLTLLPPLSTPVLTLPSAISKDFPPWLLPCLLHLGIIIKHEIFLWNQHCDDRDMGSLCPERYTGG